MTVGVALALGLIDAEWATPIGPARAVGGDAMLRAEALVGIGGYRDDLNLAAPLAA